MNKLIKTITEDKVSYEFLRSLNGIIGLTNRELQIFSILLDLYLLDIKNKKTRLSVDRTENRSFIIRNYGVSRDNLSRYIKKYKDMKLIVRNQHKTNVITAALIPDIIGGKVVQVTLILKIKENDIQQ